MSTTVDTVEIPLFPLGTVLFPEGVLPLKLFEARYLDMAARCMRANAPFGVCLIREGGEVGAPAVPYGVGSIARITGWDMDKPGLLFITTRGGERFRIVEQTTRPDRLLTAHIALLAEPPVQPVPAALGDVLPLLRAIVADAGEEVFPTPHRFDDATWVGYRLAEILPIPVLARQRLLELDDPISRLEIIQAYLRQHKLLDGG
ncbi:LON peptidase substrate-binding domain-containing protein [Zoogloea sp.]|uniref:LON peptidase substrate-binding domain-containing protein n=1 Tax=Zoogloea sp. TaxID=49181 RepID=UPI001AC9382B|nr:LON peptidase substrate-binding domain-containing protein [Zoogloea sp.]MBN8284787.1 LON peptidase substrate-binding domain-containing protein [Zoogloea sp.]